ncbi:sensor histidine kinase [Achromobacter aloeverae]|uniref:histidine kinase n=1 Tax=Achromobacter aloeverae TaxID=1750518 RepID=A0A4Q1HG48_9BURK|nr:PAS domain-containing sensor histidine kinase [Achromobacter aloeverae]RXN85998.1 PAS domain-containing sensor histidine kinase [Achromobacter aloeverae]
MSGQTKPDNTYSPHFSRWRSDAATQWRVGLPLAVILLIAAGAIAALLISRGIEHERRDEQMISDTLWAGQSIDFETNRLIESLQVLYRDVELDGGRDPGLFARRAAELQQRSPEMRLLCRLAPGEPPRQCFPQRPPAGLESAEPWMGVADRAWRLKHPAADLWRGASDRGMVLLAVPVDDGALVALVSLPHLLSDTLPWWFAHDNEVTLTDLDGNVLAVRDPGVKGRGVYQHRMDSGIAGLEFSLNANSTRELPRVVPNLLAGAVIALALLLAWSVWMLGQDLKRRMRTERALREQQAFRQAMENSLMSGLRARDLDGMITYVNPAFCDMVGYDETELIGSRPPMPYWAPENTEQSLRRHEQLLARTLRSDPFESVYLRRDGTRLSVLVSEAPLLDGNGRQTGWMASIMDVTEQKKAEDFRRMQDERINHRSRLMTLGEMASALAHELNQPLAAINSYCSAADNLLRHADRDAAASRDVHGDIGAMVSKARAQAERAGHIISRVHSFVRKAELTLAPASLAEVITGLLPLIRLQTTRGGESIQLRVPEGLPRALVDRVLLEQVVLNLTRNAFEAMAGLPPATRRVLISVRAMDVGGDGHGPLRVEVRDWGHGLAADLEQALETPFFTTKPEGMGMGLSVCRSALEMMRSHLRYETAEVGARFYFDLPAAAGMDTLQEAE